MAFGTELILTDGDSPDGKASMEFVPDDDWDARR